MSEITVSQSSEGVTVKIPVAALPAAFNITTLLTILANIGPIVQQISALIAAIKAMFPKNPPPLPTPEPIRQV